MQPGALDELFVDAGRHEQKEADRTTHRQLVVCDGPGNHNRISKNCATAGPEHTLPLLKYIRSIGEVVH
jgi:hypothetical protein